MGTDADIHFNTKSGNPPELFSMPPGFDIVVSTNTFDNVSPKFYVHNYSRYYNVGYERGNWPAICSALMILFQSEDVTEIYYNGDGSESVREITIEDVLEISRHFMQNGTRPYQQR